MSHQIPSILVGLFLVSFGSVANGIRFPTHAVTAMCSRDGSGASLLSMTLIVDINADKPGQWRGINANNGAVQPGQCDIDVTTMPSLTSVVNTANDVPDSNGCGFDVVYTNLGFKSGYRWRIRYREGPEEVYEADAGIDRLYTIVCPIDSPTNAITANIIVSTPNLDETIITKNPNATLQALYYNTGATIGAVGIATGSQYKLRATINVAHLDSPRPVGAWVKRTVISSSPDFTTDVQVIIGDTGCKTNTIWSPNDNFKLRTVQSSSTVFVHETGPATAYMFDTGSEYVHIKAIWGVCYFTNTGECTDPCTANGRRRRDVAEEEEEEVVMSIRVYNPNKTEAPQSTVSGMDSAVLIGVCVAAGVLLLLLMVAACFIVGCMRRRSRGHNQAKIPPEGFENKVHVHY